MDAAMRLSIVADLVRETAKNVAMALPAVRRWRSRFRRSTADLSNITDAHVTRYALALLAAVERAAEAGRLRHATVVEIGPGDNVAVGLALLSLGATAYHAIDPFLGDVDSPVARPLYGRVAMEMRKRPDVDPGSVPDPSTFPGDVLGTRVFLHRAAIEAYEALPLRECADIVCSYGVGQSVASGAAFARASYRFLKPGGVAVHFIDLGPNGCWTRYPNPLTFLSVPPRLWMWTTSHRGFANRVRFHEWVALFRDAGFTTSSDIQERFLTSTVDEARPFLAFPFRAMSTESLCVAAAHFVCRKPMVPQG
jgi:hypothetical protein